MQKRNGHTMHTNRGDRGGPTVSFVLPAYNEESNIVAALDSTIRCAERLCGDYEIFVVDDGSRDRTAQLVEEVGRRNSAVKLISHGDNLGYGEALRSGFEAARCDYVFFTDADNQFDLEELELLLPWADRADVVAGYRKVRRDPVMRKLNAWGWNRLVRMLFYVPVRDIDCAFKLFRREVLQGIDIRSRGAMINTEIMVKIARRGSAVVEVGVTHLPRRSGDSHGAKVSVILRALRELKAMHPSLSDLAPVATQGPAAKETATLLLLPETTGDPPVEHADDLPRRRTQIATKVLRR
jgi:glycosyltransferase involved in cell wall biosynthesis